MIHCYDANRVGSSPKLARAFAAGFPDACYTTSNTLLEGDVALFGSPRIWDSVVLEAQRQNRTWYYADHCYFGKRFEIFRVTKNAYQHTGAGSTNGERLKKFGVTFEPWRRNGRHVVVCPPDPKFAALMGSRATTFKSVVSKALEMFTDRPVVWRDRLNITKPLLEDLKGAHALVTYTSNSAVEALIHGVPVFCVGQCGASSMGSDDLARIDQPCYPDDRKRWLGVLADNQFSIDEIRNGTAWRLINEA